MPNLIKSTIHKFSRGNQGQVLVVVAVSIVGIVAIMGLALDVGMMFIDNARLRRAVDAAVLAAALQFREGYQMNELDNSAREFLSLNGIHDPDALVQVCMNPAPAPGDPDYIHHNPDLCTNPPRKLVRVVATGKAYLAFLPVINIDWVPIAAEATSETASVNVVLAIDRSESMTNDVPIGPDNMRDPFVCNEAINPRDVSYQGYCLPFDGVKEAAVSFIEQLYFPYDHVALVTFDKIAHIIEIGGATFSNHPDEIISAIKNLTVFQGEETELDTTGATSIYPHGNPSRWYDAFGTYWGLACPQTDPLYQASYPDYPSPAPCTTTNIGDGLYTAGSQFTIEMQASLWVVIVLTDGVANAGYRIPDTTPEYFCPENTWDNTFVPPKCNDGLRTTRHAADSIDYDAEDYAYDAADFVGLPFPAGQNALIFSIGLGDAVRTPSTKDGTYLGDFFLQYAANQGNGLYAYTPDSAGLREVFRRIANNIATRLAH